MLSCARVCEKFSAPDPDAHGLGEDPAAVCAAGGLLSYIAENPEI
jgi:hypothetical protein